MTFDLTNLDTRTRDLVANSTNAFEALGHVNPELLAVAYAHREGLFTSQLMPSIVRFRELQSAEKINLMHALVRQQEIQEGASVARYAIDGETTRARITADVDKYAVDGAVQITRLREDGSTSRTIITEGGLTERTRITEDNLTAREKRKMECIEYVNRLQYETLATALQAQVEGQKYIADRHVEAVHIEATARRDAIIATESIRADVARGISRDRLEERVRVATLAFEEKIRSAEIARATNRDTKKAGVVAAYIAAETRILLEYIRRSADRDRERERTMRQGLEVVKEAVKQGEKEVDLTLTDGERSMSLKYRAKEKLETS